MRLVYFVSPYDLLDTGQQSLSLLSPRLVGKLRHHASVSIAHSAALHQLQSARLVHLAPEGNKCVQQQYFSSKYSNLYSTVFVTIFVSYLYSICFYIC